MSEQSTEVKRAAIDPAVRERVWGRAAARCVLCSAWLVDEREHWHSIPVGQIAHIVAASSGAKAPRGDFALDASARAAEENLMLLCGDCHRRIDSKQYREIYTVEFLQDKKAKHERRVREVTDFATLRPATVIRLTAPVRGTIAPATPAQVGEALRHSGLTGMGAETRTGAFEIDLRHDERDPWTWDASKKEVDAVVARAMEAVAAHDTGVIAVFALAPIPTLVYLGACLDDKADVRLFPRHRGDDLNVWSWGESPDTARTFAAMLPEQAAAASDIVVLIDVTATIDSTRIPERLRGAPVVRLTVQGGVGPDTISSPADLKAFGRSWRDLLAGYETRWPRAERLHILAAVPATAATSLGRHRMRGVHPTFVVYHRTADGTYKPALEVTG